MGCPRHPGDQPAKWCVRSERNEPGKHASADSLADQLPDSSAHSRTGGSTDGLAHRGTADTLTDAWLM